MFFFVFVEAIAFIFFLAHKVMRFCVAERRVPPQFSIKPDPVYEVMMGSDLNLTCVAYGSPMPFVKWRKGLSVDMTPDEHLPTGRNVLQLHNLQQSANYTCVAVSVFGQIDVTTMVKVQCKSLPQIDG